TGVVNEKMDENNKSTTFTHRQCNCSEGNVFEATNIPLINNNTITKDCNVVLPRLDTSEINLADLLKIISKNSAEHKVMDQDVKTLPSIAKKGTKEERKCRIIENVSNKHEEEVEKGRKMHLVLTSKHSSLCNVTLLVSGIDLQEKEEVAASITACMYVKRSFIFIM
ncbi:Protein of unknown function, partial [Gryllus bimaculatus]